MAGIWYLLYNVCAVPVQYLFYQVARHFNTKVAEGIAGRRGQEERIYRALDRVDSQRKRLLFHTVSVGEWEQARPLVAGLKQADPSLYIIVMFFSPSGYNYVQDDPGVDLKVYMPFDSARSARRFLLRVKPDLFVVVKHDVWPNHLFAAGRLKIPSVLVGASLPPDSRNLWLLVRGFNRAVYRNFRFIFPVSDHDRDRFLRIYPYPERLFVCGDTRYDQVYTRGKKALNEEPMHLFKRDGEKVFIIAGSIWPSDERHLMPAVIRLLERYSSLRFVLVPHEPREKHIASIERALRSASFSSSRLSHILESGAYNIRVVIVDTVGLLARLYTQADIAYVGGSFGPGVHNVMEPAVLGKPVLFGPKHLNSFEACRLAEIGGGFPVRSSDEILNRLTALIDNKQERADAGARAREFVERNTGSSERTLKKLSELFDFLPHFKEKVYNP